MTKSKKLEKEEQERRDLRTYGYQSLPVQFPSNYLAVTYRASLIVFFSFHI